MDNLAQKWEGVVNSINYEESTFTSTLSVIIGRKEPDQVIDISFDKIKFEDMTKLRIGEIFYLTVKDQTYDIEFVHKTFEDVFRNEINENFRNQLEAIKIEVGDFFRICETISCKYDLLKARQASMKIRKLLKQFRQILLKKEKTLSETTYERVEQIKKIFHNNE